MTAGEQNFLALTASRTVQRVAADTNLDVTHSIAFAVIVTALWITSRDVAYKRVMTL